LQKDFCLEEGVARPVRIGKVELNRAWTSQGKRPKDLVYTEDGIQGRHQG